MTTVLTLVQDFCDKMSLPTPSALVGSSEKSVKQYLALLRQTVSDLGEYRWQQQNLQSTFSTVAQADQGELPSLVSSAYNGFVHNSMWNITRNVQIFGPVAEPTWQILQTWPGSGPEYTMWVASNHVYFNPIPEAGDIISFVYISKFGVRDATESAIERISADTDTLLFPDAVVMKWFEYLWRKQKGEAGWEDDYTEAMASVARNKIKDGSVALNLGGNPKIAAPGIIVPSGSWNV